MSTRNVIALKSGKASARKPDDGIISSAPRVADSDQLLAVFSNHPDACSYFQTVALKELLDRLMSGLQKNQSVYLIKGEKGCGKSAFLRWFIQQAPADWEFCPVTTGIALGEKHLLGHISKVLFPGEVLDIQALTAKIKLQTRNGAFMVIVIDDAEKLSPFALKSLFAIKEAVNKRAGRLGIVLCATEAIQSALETPSLSALGEDFVSTLLLPCISSQQLSDYIQHRIKTAGVEGKVMFTPQQLSRVYKISRGLPKSINLVVQDLLQGRKAMPPFALLHDRLAHYRVFILSVAGFGLIFGGGYTAYRSLLDSTPPATLVTMTSLPDLRVPVPPLGSMHPQGFMPLRVHKPLRADEPMVEKPLPSKGSAVVVEPIQTTAALVQQGGLVKPETSSTPDKLQKRERPKLQQPTAASETSTPVVSETVRDSAWVLAQDSRYFTVQLTSWEKEERARKYIKKHGLVNDAAYVHTRSKGKDWYLVVYRAYPNLKQARQGISALSPSLKKYGPWVRNISSLQTEAVVE